MTDLDHGCRAMLVVVLATAASSKLAGRDPLGELARAISGLGLPGALARKPLAAIVLVAEAASAALLVVAPSLGYGLALVLLAGFTFVIARALRAGRRVSCRCFGSNGASLGRAHLLRNLVLLASAIAGAAARWGSAGAPHQPWWLSVLVGVVLGAAVTRWEELAYLAGSSAPRAPG